MKATGTKTDRSTRVIATMAPVISDMAARAASAGVISGCSSSFASTASTTTMASSTTIPIASTIARSETVLIVNPSACIAAKVPTRAIGTAMTGTIVARSEPRKMKTTSTTRTKASISVTCTSWMLSSMKIGVVRHEGDARALREGQLPLRIRHGRLDACGGRKGVPARRQIDADQRCRGAVVGGHDIARACAEADARHVAHPQDRATGVGAQDDALEFGRVRQPALGRDVELQARLVQHRLRAHAPDGGLHVLALQRRDHVARGQAEGGQAVDVEIDVHGELVGREDAHVAHAGDTLERVDQVQVGVIGQRWAIYPVILGVKDDARQKRRRALESPDAKLAYLGRQERLGQRHAVLHVDHGDVGIGAHLEADRQGIAPVGARVRAHVDHVLDADHLVLDRLSDGLFGDLGAGAGIGRRHLRSAAARHRGKVR